MVAGATVTLLDVVASALTRLAEKMRSPLAESATALAADRAELGRRLAKLRNWSSNPETIERLFYRTWITAYWILFDDLSYRPPGHPLPDAEEKEWRRVWQLAAIANPRRDAVIRARTAEDPDTRVVWAGHDSAFVPTGGKGPSIHADLGAALVRASVAFGHPSVDPVVAQAVQFGWQNYYGRPVSLVDVATDAFACGAVNALGELWSLLAEGEPWHADRFAVAAFLAAALGLADEARYERRAGEFAWYVSGWNEPAERWLSSRRPTMDDLDPLLTNAAQEFGIPKPALEAFVRAGLDTPAFATAGGARQSILEAASGLERLLAEMRPSSQPGESLAAVFKAIVDALDDGDLARADQTITALMEEFKANAATFGKSDQAFFLARMSRFRANISSLRFNFRDAARDYDRSATAIADELPLVAIVAHSAQASALRLLAEHEGDSAHLRAALELWREEIAPLARTSGQSEALVAANIGLGNALLGLANQTGDLAFITEAVPAFRAGLYADRLVALDGPGPAATPDTKPVASLSVLQVQAGLLLVQSLLRIAFEDREAFLAEAGATLDLLGPSISRETYQTHWGWHQMLEIQLAIERSRAGPGNIDLDEIATRLTEAAESLRGMTPVLSARCWLLLGQQYLLAACRDDESRLAPSIEFLLKAMGGLSPAENDLWRQVTFDLSVASHMAFQQSSDLAHAAAWLGYLRAGRAGTTRQRSPLRWVTLHQRLGEAYAFVFERGGHPDLLDAAVASYREALTGQTQLDSPDEWLRTTFALGQVLADRGSWHRNRAQILEAITLLNEARSFVERRGDRESLEVIDRRLARASTLAKALDAPQAPPTRGLGAWLRQKLGGPH